LYVGIFLEVIWAIAFAAMVVFVNYLPQKGKEANSSSTR
jgi:hypothetical protein